VNGDIQVIPADLNDAQARHAIQLFYDNLPDSAWEDDKPSVERVNTVVRALVESSDRATSNTLSELTNDKNLAAQAGVARLVLTQALATPSLADSAGTAIAASAKANMMFDPVSGLLIIGVLLATTKFDKNADGSIHVELGGSAASILSALRVPELLDKLPGVIKALPAAILQKVL
jgi:hypothetical protein